MLFPEKGRSGFIKQSFQFQGYRILSVIGRGSNSTVYLAEHQKLGEYRAVKCILKDNPDHTRLIWEAELLKHLKHPQIPILYDMTEDDTSLYLIEEFIEGESLEAFMLHQQFISPIFICDIGIKLCRVLSYLHERKPYPVIYQDLKPEHIILSKDTVKLIDFDISAVLSNQGNKFQNYGTPQYAAPEKKYHAKVDITTDIYALGRLLELLAASGHAGVNLNLKHILKKAVSQDSTKRYASMKDMLQALGAAKEDMCQKQNPIEGKHLLKNIAVIGSQPHIGATHLSVSLTVYLNQHGNQALYTEKNANQDVFKMTRYNSSFAQKNGLYRNRHFYGLPLYGAGVLIEPDQDVMQVCDYGTNMDQALDSEAGLYILMVGSRDWECEAAHRAYDKMKEKQNLVVLCNYERADRTKEYAADFDRLVYGFPLDADPYHITKKKAELFLKLLKWEGGNNIRHDKPDRWYHKLYPGKRSHAFGHRTFELCSIRSLPKNCFR